MIKNKWLKLFLVQISKYSKFNINIFLFKKIYENFNL